jgi:hypothetical protein
MHPRNAGEFFFSSPHVTPQQDKLLFFNPAHIPATALYFFFFPASIPATTSIYFSYCTHPRNQKAYAELAPHLV